MPHVPKTLIRHSEINSHSHSIGTGATGSVSHAVVGCSEYAVKMMVPDQSNEIKHCLMIQEMVIMYVIDHPCIVTCHNVLDTNNTLYIVMEYMECGLLKKCMSLQKQSLPLPGIVAITVNILSVMQVLHNCLRIIHTDVKPDNIVIHHNGYAKLTDLGVCSQIDTMSIIHTNAGSFIGSSFYFAPDLLVSDSYMFSCDIFSIGIVLLEIVKNECAVYYSCQIWHIENMPNIYTRLCTQHPMYRVLYCMLQNKAHYRLSAVAILADTQDVF